MKYEIGEIIKIRTDLQCGCSYPNEQGGTEMVVSEMLGFAGQVSRISDILDGYYILEGTNYWLWTDGMLESIKRYMLNFVFVEFSQNEEPHIFRVPQGVKLKYGQDVFVKTVYGKDRATVIADSFEMNVISAYEICKGLGIKGLKSVTGYAVKEWTEQEFEVEV